MEVYADRVEISNPGGLPSGLSPEEFGNKSVARNPLIASLLHRIDYIEKIGTGISRIRQAVAEHSGVEVEIRYNEFFTVSFRAKALRPTPVTGSVDSSVESSVESSVQILLLLADHPTMTIPKMAKQMNLTTRAVEKNIKKLQQQHKLKRVGPNKGGHWEVLGQVRDHE